jgi:hypothetical protein
VKPRLTVMYTHTHREGTPNRDLHTHSLTWSHALPWFVHILFIVKPRLIVIYMYTLYREVTPNRNLCTYTLSWSHASLWLINILFIVKPRLIVINMDTQYWHIYTLRHFQLITKYKKNKHRMLKREVMNKELLYHYGHNICFHIPMQYSHIRGMST